MGGKERDRCGCQTLKGKIELGAGRCERRAARGCKLISLERLYPAAYGNADEIKQVPLEGRGGGGT